MSDSLQDLSNNIFNIKEKLNDNEFKKIMDLLGDIFEEMKNNVSNENNYNMSTITNLLSQIDTLSSRNYELKMDLGDSEMMLNHTEQELERYKGFIREQQLETKYHNYAKSTLEKKCNDGYIALEIECRRQFNDEFSQSQNKILELMAERKKDEDIDYELKKHKALDKINTHLQKNKCRASTKKGKLCSRNGKHKLLGMFYFCSQHKDLGMNEIRSGWVEQIYNIFIN